MLFFSFSVHCMLGIAADDVDSLLEIFEKGLYDSLLNSSRVVIINRNTNLSAGCLLITIMYTDLDSETSESAVCTLLTESVTKCFPAHPEGEHLQIFSRSLVRSSITHFQWVHCHWFSDAVSNLSPIMQLILHSLSVLFSVKPIQSALLCP